MEMRGADHVAGVAWKERRSLQRWLVLRVCVGTLPILSACTAGEEDAHRPIWFTGDTVTVIGAVDGADHEVFGRLSAAAAHELHGLFLLDLQAGSVLWYGLDGRFRRALAARGQGPRELDTPWAIHITPGGALWVLDRGNARISTYSIEGVDDIAYDRSIPGVFPDGSLCMLEGRLFRGGLYDGHVLHETGEDGTLVHSMWPEPEIPNVEAERVFGRLVESQVGMVHCAEDEGIVVVASGSEVRAFDVDAAIRWETQLEGITPIPFVLEGRTDVRIHAADAGGRLRGDPDPDRGANFLRSIVPWDESTLLLQYEIRLPGEPTDGRDFHGIDSRLIDMASGQEVARSRDIPWIAARTPEHVVLLENVPFPRAMLVHLRDITTT